ncbi:hypothetical protein MKW92_028045 [Papaver armeniacum]|nr:hypothetical protein MKW92_028045 [Papaver armeniacum]
MGSLTTGNLESMSICSRNPLDPDEFRRQVEPGYLHQRLPENQLQTTLNPLKPFFKM